MTNPLADRIRPESLEQVVGQQHLLGPGKALRQLIESGDIPNLIFYGPPGVARPRWRPLLPSARIAPCGGLTAPTPLRRIFGHWWQSWTPLSAPNGIFAVFGRDPVFYKRQQQSLAGIHENGKITLIASTTENPIFYSFIRRCSAGARCLSSNPSPRQMWCPRWSGASRLLEEENGIPAELGGRRGPHPGRAGRR